MKNLSFGILLVWLAVCPAARSVTLTFNGGAVQQTIDGIGVNVNSWGWQGTNVQPVLNAFMDQAGMSLFRVVHDLTDWEQVNDDASPTNMNWAYYNAIYGSGDLVPLWNTMAYLNSQGFTDRAYFSFMGWGPDWMMDPSYVVNGVKPRLAPGMEAEWAETVTSAAIYARNNRGLKFSLFSPNNEPDLNFEGVAIPTAQQYTNTIRAVVDLLNQNNITNLFLVAPDRSSGNAAWFAEMTNSPAIMNRLAHFGTHSYADFGGTTTNAVNFVQGSAYADRGLWLTEFNKWCTGCDDGIAPAFPWSYTRGTAENLLWHLDAGASAAFVWEGFDSVYKHHFNAWGYWGLFGINNTAAVVKTWSPRKHFYTVSQISKWVRPGARVVGVVGGTAPLTPLVAFRNDALGQVTIVGVNTAASPTQLIGTLTNLPVVTALDLYYTSQSSNLAHAARVPVGADRRFTNTIPADCVFTLTGFTASPLTNGVASTVTQALAGAVAHFRVTVTNPVARVQFEVLNPTGDVALRVGKGVPADDTLPAFFGSDNPGTDNELVVMRPGDNARTVEAGEWFLSVSNKLATPVNYTVRLTQGAVSGAPLLINSFTTGTNQTCFTWNTVPGGLYVVQGKPFMSTLNWTDISATLTATGSTFGYCITGETSNRFFRVIEGVSTVAP